MKTIQEILKQWKAEVNLHGVIQFSFNRSSGEMCIYTHDSKKLLRQEKKYTEILKEKVRGLETILFIETAHYWA